MLPSQDDTSAVRAAFRLGEWSVEPELGRISRAGTVVQLRPRAMEVLVALADLNGGLASKQHLIDTVWRTEFVSDNALTHVVAELRNALGDDTDNPSHIETIPRRGYRLIAPVTRLEEKEGGGAAIEKDSLIKSPSSTEDNRELSRAPARQTHTRWLAPGGVAFLALIAIGVWFVIGELRMPAPEHSSDFVSNRVVVAEFENRIGDSSFGDFGNLVADSITTLLRRVGRLTVATNPYRIEARRGERRDMANAGDSPRRLAEITRSSLVVTGTCYSRGSQVEIQAQIVDPWLDEIKQTFDGISAPLNDLSPAVEVVSQQVAGTLALHFNNMIPLGLSRPVRLAAYQEFAGSLDFWGVDVDASAASLKRALEIEPTFVLARTRLIAWFSSVGMTREAESELEVLEAQLPTLTALDRLAVVVARAQFERRPLEALRGMREAVDLAPSSHWLRRELGRQAIAVNRPGEAVDALRRIPYDWPSGGAAFASSPHFLRCFALHMLGDYEEQLRVAAESHQYFPDRMVFYGLQGNALAALGRFDKLDRIVEQSRTISVRGSSWGFSQTFTARELRAHGFRERSLELAEQIVSWYREHPDEMAWSPLGPAWGYPAALSVAERWDEAREVIDRLNPDRLNKVQCLGLAGVLEARLGHEDRARRIAELLDDLQDQNSLAESRYWKACIASQLGHLDEAMRLLQRAFSEGHPFSDELHRDINLEPLWHHPPFLKLIRPKG